MYAGTYTNRGEAVPLGMECALPYLDYSTRSSSGDGMESGKPALYLVKGQRHAAAAERLDPVHS